MMIGACLLLAMFMAPGNDVSNDKAEATAIVGQWLTSGKDARIEIFKENETYSGKIVWVKEPRYPKNDPEAGKPVRDRENPDTSKRDRPIVGLTLISGLQYVGDSEWRNGTIYNAQNGKTYRVNVSLTKDNRLNVHGYVGVPVLGLTTVWTRYTDTAKAPQEGTASSDSDRQQKPEAEK